jgi:hypothetical protein
MFSIQPALVGCPAPIRKVTVLALAVAAVKPSAVTNSVPRSGFLIFMMQSP